MHEAVMDPSGDGSDRAHAARGHAATRASLLAALLATACAGGCGSWSRGPQPPSHDSQVNLAAAATARLLPAPAAVRVFCPTWDPTAASSGDTTRSKWIECHAVLLLAAGTDRSAAALIWLAARAFRVHQPRVGTVNDTPVLLVSAHRRPSTTRRMDRSTRRGVRRQEHRTRPRRPRLRTDRPPRNGELSAHRAAILRTRC